MMAYNARLFNQKPAYAMSKTLPQTELKNLRRIGHELKPVVLMGGNGLTDALVAEIIRALDDHELIKIKLLGDDKTERRQIATEICTQTGAVLVQQVGKMGLFYKKSLEPNARLSNIIRHS